MQEACKLDASSISPFTCATLVTHSPGQMHLVHIEVGTARRQVKHTMPESRRVDCRNAEICQRFEQKLPGKIRVKGFRSDQFKAILKLMPSDGQTDWASRNHTEGTLICAAHRAAHNFLPFQPSSPQLRFPDTRPYVATINPWPTAPWGDIAPSYPPRAPVVGAPG
jgi:hypothetical protein